jgi:hypothetical protein
MVKNALLVYKIMRLVYLFVSHPYFKKMRKMVQAKLSSLPFLSRSWKEKEKHQSIQGVSALSRYEQWSYAHARV